MKQKISTVKMLALALAGAFMMSISSCGSGDQGAKEAQEQETSSETTTEMPEDKSKRPSPPATVTATIGSANIEIEYSRPSAKGRIIWGDVVPYGQVWRTGANEATTIELSTDVKIEGQAVAAGKYALFTIPGESEWVIILNKDYEQWGAYNYAPEKDVLRVNVKPEKLGEPVEVFTIAITDQTVKLSWADMAASFSIQE
jgi:hypothetical protein